MAKSNVHAPASTSAAAGAATANPPMSKADKACSLANKRVPKAIKAIRILRNLGNVKVYEFTDEQRAKIIAALKDAVKEVENAFAGSKSTDNGWQL